MLEKVKSFYNHIRSYNTDSAIKRKQESYNADSFGNPHTGVGISDRSSSFFWNYTQTALSKEFLTDVYNTEGIAKRIIDSYVEEGLRSFINTDSKVLEEIKRLKLKKIMFEAARDARLYGGSIVVAFIDDGGQLTDELNFNNLNKLIHLKCYDRYQVSWDVQDLISDYYDENYGQPLYYTISNNANANSDLIQFKVHESRVFRFNGEQTTQLSKKRNQGWDNSCLLPIMEKIKHFSSTSKVTAEIIQGYTETVIKVPELSFKLKENMTDGQPGKCIADRINHLNSSKGPYKTIFLDADEDFQKHPANVHGLSELWDRFAETIASVSGIPVSVLFGRSPAGLNATGKQELELWNNKIEEYRNDELKPFLDWIFKILKNEKELRNKGIDFTWEFHPLITLDEELEARTRKLNAEIDKIYVEMGAVDAATIFNQRYRDGQSFDNNIIFTQKELNESEKLLQEQAKAEFEAEKEDSKRLLKEMKEEEERRINKDSEDLEEKIRRDKLNDFALQKIEQWGKK